MNVLIVDDHGIARRGLEQMLAATFELGRCVGVENGRDALEAAPVVRPDLIVMDLDLPGHPRGGSLCAQLRALVPAAVIVIVTAFHRGGEVEQCVAAGATGALLKETADADMADAFRRVMSGEAVVSPELAARPIPDDTAGLEVRLTAREREVLDMLADGCSNREISERLVLSEATVKDHVGGLMRKLGVTSRLQAVIRASELGLL